MVSTFSCPSRDCTLSTGAPALSHLDATIAAGSDDAEERASGTVNLTSISLELVTDTSVQTVGMRFTGVNIPPGAVIQNAWIQFTVQAASSDATSLTLQAEASDNPATFTTASNNISTRPRTTASVSWTPVSWNTVDEAGTDQRTPNLASVIQEIVDRPGWASGNALAILITGSGKRVAKSYERDVYGAPYLHIEYTLQTPQLQLQITPNPTSFTGSGQSIGYTYTLTNTGDVPLNGPYLVSDDKVSSVDCSAATSPLAIGANTTCVGSYTTTAADVTAGSIVNSATATASDGVGTITSNVATATVTLQIPPLSVTIDYVYDHLYRLEQANYSNNDYYHYTYDAVGNRLTQASMVSGLPSTVNYAYDDANRLASVNGVNYAWDNNGNLLNDGVNAYMYNSANQLKTMTGPSVAVSYRYDGLGDRLQEIIGEQTTTFAMGYNTDLTQVLNDGTNTYIYGNERIAQVNTNTEYFLGDALGSVRQLTNISGAVRYASAYDPYGVTVRADGDSPTAYGYTGEYAANDLVYLRARYYDPAIGRFLTSDTWGGDANSPMSFNMWNYVSSNPINRLDPSGHCYIDDQTGACIRSPHRLPVSALSIPSDPNASLTVPAQDIRFAGNWYVNLCGQFSVEMVIEAINGGRTYPIEALITLYNTRSGTGNWELGELAAKALGNRAHVYGYHGMATYTYTGDDNYDWVHGIKALGKNWDTGMNLLSTLDRWLKMKNYLIVSGVLDTTTSMMVDHEPKDRAGARYVRHWVAVREINGDNITIINPYRNRIEEYSWSELFKGSMERNKNSVIRIISR